jgi:tetratricopeptide (TPR) repeat protein
MRPFALDLAQGLFSAYSLGLSLSLGLCLAMTVDLSLVIVSGNEGHSLLPMAVAQSEVTQEFGKEIDFRTPAEQLQHEARRQGPHHEVTAWETFFEQGQGYLAAKSYERAETSFRQALRSIKKVPHSQDQLAACMRALADVLQLEDYKELSWDLYRQSLKILEKAHGENSIVLLPQLVTMGSVSELEGEYLKAIPFFSRAADIARAKLGDQSYQLAVCQSHLGHAYFCSGNSVDAEKNYRQALYLMMTQSSLPSRDALLQLLSDYNDLLLKYKGPSKNLASVYEKELLKDDTQSAGRLRAIPQSAFQQAILKREAAEQAGAITTANNLAQTDGAVETFSTVAQLLNAIPAGSAGTSSGAAGTGNTSAESVARTGSEGIDYYERMIAIDVRTLGPHHPSVARDLRGLAALYISEHRYSEAVPLLQRAIEIYSSVYPATDLSVQRLRLLLSLITDNANAAADLEASIAAESPALAAIAAGTAGGAASGTAGGAESVAPGGAENVAESVAPGGATRAQAPAPADSFGASGQVAKPILAVKIPIEAQTFEVAQRLNEIAFRTFCQGKLADARVNYSWALSSISNATGSRSVFTSACLQDYARVMRVSGYANQADQMQRESRVIAAEVLSQQLLRAYK